MGFFDKLFGKEEKKDTFVAPITGELVKLEDVPDPVFSQKMMGEGFAIKPSTGEVVSPVDGTIVTFFPTKHAVGIKDNDGNEILIHFGLETVGLKGEGFEALVSEGATVKAGQTLLKADLTYIGEHAKSTITPVVFTNTNGKTLTVKKYGPVTAGDSGIIDLQ